MENTSFDTNEQNNVDTAMTINGDTQITHEASEEFSLPDYVPEVRRVLLVRAQPLPESKYLADNSLEFSGMVTYSLIYTNDEGKLCALPLSTSYDAKVGVNSDTGSTIITTTVDSTTCRVIAPRKVSIKTKLKSRVMSFANSDIGEKITPRSSADELYIERKKEKINTMEIMNANLQNIRISEKLDITGEENIVPIWCDAGAILTDVKSQTDIVNVRGEITVKCLCTGENGEVILTKTMPLSEIVEAPNAELGDMVKAEARVVSLSISNEQTSDKNELFFDLNLELECEIARNGEIEVTKDAYSTKYNMETTYKSVDVFTATREQNASFTVSEGQKRKDKELSEIISVMADPVYEKSEIKGSKINHLGKLLVNILGKSTPDENGKWEYLSQSYELPIKYESDVGKISKNAISNCTFSLGNTNVRFDDENMFLTAEVFVSYSVYDKNTVELLDTGILKKESEIKRDSGCVRVCFPRENESLWDIAKKYHTTVNKLMEQNDISDQAQIKKSLIV
ncbi:MAG: DUF3794 domain-containing protein [Clostridia bacterium]|nr:DUF3794 domain-containing protein [Clostridia bacterium]